MGRWHAPRPRCRVSDPPQWGANAIFDIVDRKLQFRSYYKLPAPQGEQENCVAHNGSLVPVPGRDIMVHGWYQGGISVFDFTDSAHPVEIAYFDRGPVDPVRLITAGYWSSYWYNGAIYGAEIARGLDVFRLTPSAHLSQSEIAAAAQIHLLEFNSQEQPRFVWPASSQVARAYVDQLVRSTAMPPSQAAAIRSVLDGVDELRTGREGRAPALLVQLDTLAGQLRRDAGAARGQDAIRWNALAQNLVTRAGRLR